LRAAFTGKSKSENRVTVLMCLKYSLARPTRRAEFLALDMGEAMWKKLSSMIMKGGQSFMSGKTATVQDMGMYKKSFWTNAKNEVATSWLRL
jgi:hypothetical protein